MENNEIERETKKIKLSSFEEIKELINESNLNQKENEKLSNEIIKDEILNYIERSIEDCCVDFENEYERYQKDKNNSLNETGVENTTNNYRNIDEITRGINFFKNLEFIDYTINNDENIDPCFGLVSGRAIMTIELEYEEKRIIFERILNYGNEEDDYNCENSQKCKIRDYTQKKFEELWNLQGITDDFYEFLNDNFDAITNDNVEMSEAISCDFEGNLID